MKDTNEGGVLGSFVRSKFEQLIKVQEPEIPDEKQFIKCRNLVKIYRINKSEVFALQGLELNIEKGEMVGIIGSSGSGKSTLLNILGGLDSPTGGLAQVAGWNLNQMSYRDKILFKRDVVGFVWQNVGRNLIPYLTALENVRLPMILSGNHQDVEWAKTLLEAVGLKERMDHRPAEMSGGQQQRVAIAVALANRPEILLADEPTGSLDSETGTEIFKVLKKTSVDFGVTIVVVTHDRSLSGAVDRAIEIRDGKISTESVRQRQITESDVEEVQIGFKARAEDSSTHNKYTIVDSAGRLQIPEEYLEELNIKGRAALEMEEGRVIVKPPEDQEE